MRERMKDILVRYSKEQEVQSKAKAMFNARQEVDINGNGTSGYTIKHGPNAGVALKHISVKHHNSR
jgi:hypothetical protein